MKFSSSIVFYGFRVTNSAAGKPAPHCFPGCIMLSSRPAPSATRKQVWPMRRHSSRHHQAIHNTRTHTRQQTAPTGFAVQHRLPTLPTSHAGDGACPSLQAGHAVKPPCCLHLYSTWRPSPCGLLQLHPTACPGASSRPAPPATRKQVWPLHRHSSKHHEVGHKHTHPHQRTHCTRRVSGQAPQPTPPTSGAGDGACCPLQAGHAVKPPCCLHLYTTWRPSPAACCSCSTPLLPRVHHL